MSRKLGQIKGFFENRGNRGNIGRIDAQLTTLDQ